MPLATRHRDDPRPDLTPLPGLAVRREHDAARMAALQQKPAAEMARRFAAGHRAYVAMLDGAPAAWGWVGTREAEIGELATRFAIPAGERYLWNFVTPHPYRGLGIYPRLVDAIVRAEACEAARFWIAAAPENHASGSGIRKAGFSPVAELSFDGAGRPALEALVPGGGALASRLLGLAESRDPLAPCWRCIRAGKSPATACREGRCCCDYQEPASGCAA